MHVRKRLMLLDEDTRMIQETVAKFVDRELIPMPATA
jgi:hypothetical protein